MGWDEAIGTMAHRFRETQQKYGPESVGVISTGQLVTEEFYTLGKLVQLGLGTRNYDGNTTLCMSTAVAGYKRSFGSDGPPGAYEDLERADVILLIGANIADNHPILWQRLEANPGKTLIVVDPRVTKTAMLADLHLPVKPRSDLALINGLIHILIEEDLIDREYIAAHTTGFEELRASVREYTPERVSDITGLPPDLIRQTALLYGTARAGFIAWTMGVNHSTKGTETVNAINNLALITGHIGRSGAAPFSITGQCNAMGTREAGFASSLPGYRKFELAEDREAVAAIWNVPVDRIPAARGLAYPDIIEAALSKTRPRAVGDRHQSDRVVSQPRRAPSGARYARLPRGPGRIPSHAHVRARAPRAAGRHLGRKGRDVHQFRTPRQQGEPRGGSAWRSPQRLRHLSRISRAALGCADELFPGWTTPQDAFEEWKRVSAGRLCDYSGMSYDAIDQHGGIQWPHPAGATDAAETKRLYADGRFQTEDGKARLIAVGWEPFPEQPTDEFSARAQYGPHGRALAHAHEDRRGADSRTAVAEPLGGDEPARRPEAAAEGVRTRGRRVAARTYSQPGARLTETVAPGQVFVPFHWATANANQATQSSFDPISREPNYKQSAVRVERAL